MLKCTVCCVALVPNWCPKAQMYDLLPLLWFRKWCLNARI